MTHELFYCRTIFLPVLLFSIYGITEAKIRKSLFREGKPGGIIIIIFAPEVERNSKDEQRRELVEKYFGSI
jgi:hypothetical protein